MSQQLQEPEIKQFGWMYIIFCCCCYNNLTEANKSNETVKNFAPEIVIAFWHCWQTICTKVFASSDPSYQWQEYAASITDELCEIFFKFFLII